MRRRERRTPAEWTTLLISAAIVLGVVTLIALQIPGDDRPAEPAARIEEVQQVGAVHQVSVVVSNAGDKTAAQVQVTAELATKEGGTTAEQTLDFLSGGDEKKVVFIFDDDLAPGDLRVSVTGYAVP